MDVVEYAEKFRRMLISRDAAAERRLIAAYKQVYVAVGAQIDALILAIAQTEEMTAGQLVRMTRYQRLMADLERELTKFSGVTQAEIAQLTRDAIRAGADDARYLTAVGLGDVKLAAMLKTLSPTAVETLLGFLAPDGPLYARLNGLPAYTAEQVSRALIDGLSLGKSPRASGRVLNAMGMGLTDALRMTRTAQIWAYRESTRATYLANSDVLQGWVWYANLATACPACLAMHGTVHPLTETLNDHHNGRCVMLPLTIGSTNELAGAGEAYFRSLPEAKQKELLGPGKYEAWKSGKFAFSDLATEHTDEVYGPMRSVASLATLTTP